MPADENKTPDTSMARLRRRRTRRRSPSPAKNAALILGIVLIFGTGLGISRQGIDFFRFLYHPMAIIVVILLLIQYIILKGRDKSRIYRIELEQARRKRQEDLEFFQRLEATIQKLEVQAQSKEHTAVEMREQLEQLRESIASRL